MPTVHEQYEQLIPEYLLGRVDPQSAGDLERHLLSCALCRARLNELKPVVGLLEHLPRPQLPAHYFNSFLPRVRERLEHRKSAFSSVPNIGRVVVRLAALGLAIALLVHVPLNRFDEGNASLKEIVGSMKSDDLVDVLAAETASGTLSQGSAAEAVAEAFSEKEISRQLARSILEEGNAVETVFPHNLADVDEQELELILQKLGERTLL